MAGAMHACHGDVDRSIDVGDRYRDRDISRARARAINQ